MISIIIKKMLKVGREQKAGLIHFIVPLGEIWLGLKLGLPRFPCYKFALII